MTWPPINAASPAPSGGTLWRKSTKLWQASRRHATYHPPNPGGYTVHLGQKATDNPAYVGAMQALTRRMHRWKSPQRGNDLRRSRSKAQKKYDEVNRPRQRIWAVGLARALAAEAIAVFGT